MNEAKSPMKTTVPVPITGDIDRFFNRMVKNWPFNWLDVTPGDVSRTLRVFDHLPKAEVKENGKAYTIAVELPGFDEKDIKVEVANDVLTVSGEKKTERSDEKTHYSERSYGSFARSFSLPEDADREKISAQYAKGVLTLEIAKSAMPAAPVKQVAIKTA